MSDPEKIIFDGDRHFQLVTVEPTATAAAKLVEQLYEQGFQPGTVVLTDGRVEVYTKFALAQEVETLLVQQNCQRCTVKPDGCGLDKCVTSVILANTRFHESMGWNQCLRRRLRQLQANARQ